MDEDALIALFCSVDDFCQQFEREQQQLLLEQDIANRRWWATRNVNIHRHDFMDSAYTGHGCQFRIIGHQSVGISTFCFNVGAFQRFFNGEEVAHGRNAAKYSAITKGYQYFAALAHAFGNFHVIRVVYATFENANIDTGRIGFFQVSDG